MNTFGKILVVCNLLVALAAVSFFLATRPRQIAWKSNSEEKDEQLIVARGSSKAKDDDIKNLVLAVKNSAEEANLIKKEMARQADKFRDDLEAEKAKITAAKLETTAAVLSTERAQAEIDRLKVEITAIAKSLQRSEQDKLALQDLANRYRKEAAEQKTDRDVTQQRNLNLVDLLREKDKVIAQLTKNAGAGTGPGATFIAKNPNDPNPPPVKVKGQVMAVSRDKNDGAGFLVSLSVGADDGVSKNHTLDVYRTFPTPEYLGRVRIIDVTERGSIGRLVGRDANNNTNLRVGDLVVDTIASLTKQ